MYVPHTIRRLVPAGLATALLALVALAPRGWAQGTKPPGQLPGMATTAPQALPLQTLSMPDQTLPWAFANLPYHSSVMATGGVAPYRFVINGDVPPGLLVQPGFTVITIGGFPTTPGNFSFQVTAIDSDGAKASHDFTLQVNAPLFHPEIQMVNIADPESITTTDANNVFFPAVINLSEPITITDTTAVFFPSVIHDAESITTSDAIAILLSAITPISESITTTDTIAINTPLGVTPTPAGLPSGTVNAVYPFTTFSAAGNTGTATLVESGAAPAGMTWATSGGKPVLYGTPTVGGTFPFTITARDSINTSIVTYSLFINGAAQTITFGTNPTLTYGNAPFTISATSTSGLPVTVSILAGPATGSNPFSITGAGFLVLAGNQSGNANYVAASTVDDDIVIAKAPLTGTATSTSRVFDQPNPAFTYTYATFVNGDNASAVSGAPTLSSTAVPTSTAASTYPITITTGSTASANYTLSFASGTLSITKAPQTITFYTLPALAHGTTFPLSARSSSGLAVTYTVTGPASITNNILSVTGTGTVSITASQTGNSNYNAAASVIRSFTAQ